MLFTILALSLTFASCADSTDTDDENPSPALPANVGENPIKETIKLKESDSDSYFLELKTDGTARAAYFNESNVEETDATYKYSYDDNKETITMIVEKYCYENLLEAELQLLTYGEIRSKINEEFTVEKMRQAGKKYYEIDKNKEWFKEDYPDCDTYEKYEAAFLKKYGYDSYNDYVKSCRQDYERTYKAMFGVQITYSYKNEDGKLTLTEKFTGVKNLCNSRCRFSGGSNYASIRCSYASIDYYNDGTYSYYYGDVNTDKKTISFESEDGNGEKVNATYTEDIYAGTVTINFKDKEYVCEFDGAKYTQVE